MKTIRSCLAGIGCLTLIAAAAGGAWYYRSDIQGWWSSRAEVPELAVEPSEEIAARAEERLRALAGDDPPAEARLSEVEVQSLVLFRVAPRLPDGVSEPLATLQDSTVEVSALLDLERLADRLDSDAADRLQQFIGDTARVKALLHPWVAEPGRGDLAILRLQAGLFPVPPLLIPGMITQLGFSTSPGKPTAMTITIPPEISGVSIREDELIVRRTEP